MQKKWIILALLFLPLTGNCTIYRWDGSIPHS